MKKKYEHKMNMKHILRVMFVCLITLAMVSSLLTVPVKAATVADADTADTKVTPSGWWTDNGNYDTSWYNSSQQNFTITTAQQLAGLAYLVNAGTDFSGKTITLGADIDLGAHYWKPIGGNGTYSGSVPNGNAFAGDFDGGYTNSDGTLDTRVISNMMIQWNVGDTTPAGIVSSTTDYGGFGLFGYVTNGTIENLTVKGSITSNAVAYCVGGIAGYTSGSIYHCQNEVEIAIDNTSPSQCGGIAGTVENTTKNGVRYVQFCSNTANVQGRGRIGGIVGAVYCSNTGGVVVDNCYNTGNLKTVSSARRAYVGGIVGYCVGYVQNCYSVATLISTDDIEGGHYMAGLVGLLQGNNPQAKLMNSYTVPSFTLGNASYDYLAYASADRSNTLQINNVLWVPTGSIEQPTATGSNGWGFWTKSGSVTASNLKKNENATVYTTGVTDSESIPALTVLGGQFVAASSDSQNQGYPVLKWQKNGVTYSNFTPGTGGVVITSDKFYVSNEGSDDNTGTESTQPFKTLGRAVSFANRSIAETVTIYVMNTITIQGESIYGSMTGTANKINVVKYNGSSSDTVMFEVKNNNSNVNYIGGITLDSTGFDTAFKVTGTLAFRNDAVVSGSATAFDVASTGKLTLNRSKVTGSTNSVKVATGAYFEIGVGSGQVFTISGTIDLGIGTKIAFSDPVPCDMTVECASPSAGLEIATGISTNKPTYDLTVADADHISYVTNDYGVMRRTDKISSTTTLVSLVLATPVYLNGSAASGGTGTMDKPYNNLRTAMNATDGSKMIIVTGTTALETTTYFKTVTIQRGKGFTGTMFTVNSSNITGTLSTGLTITGRGSGTLVTESSGTLLLTGGVTMTNCDIDVDVIGGDFTLQQAEMDANQYSVRVGQSSGTFTLNPYAVTSIDGTIYLETGKYIQVSNPLTNISGNVAVQCANPVSGRVVAQKSVGSFSTGELQKLTYVGNAYAFALSSDNRQILLNQN